MAARIGTRINDPDTRLIAIEDLEEARGDAVERTRIIQAKRKVEFDWKLSKDHGIKEGGLVLLYDNRYKDFLGKLHTRWMGPSKVTQIFPNGSLQLEDLQGNWLDTRMNGYGVKRYLQEPCWDSGLDSQDSDVRRDSDI